MRLSLHCQYSGRMLVKILYTGYSGIQKNRKSLPWPARFTLSMGKMPQSPQQKEIIPL